MGKKERDGINSYESLLRELRDFVFVFCFKVVSKKFFCCAFFSFLACSHTASPIWKDDEMESSKHNKVLHRFIKESFPNFFVLLFGVHVLVLATRYWIVWLHELDEWGEGLTVS